MTAQESEGNTNIASRIESPQNWKLEVMTGRGKMSGCKVVKLNSYPLKTAAGDPKGDGDDRGEGKATYQFYLFGLEDAMQTGCQHKNLTSGKVLRMKMMMMRIGSSGVFEQFDPVLGEKENDRQGELVWFKMWGERRLQRFGVVQ
ncbi:unnamed protein product [Orchesella dallaii]|uniref:Uncharacterized protein n=1 Tax=Orchesella dallaii TaxID=48710 RepID=A0ABP1PTG8_9HEXA